VPQQACGGAEAAQQPSPAANFLACTCCWVFETNKNLGDKKDNMMFDQIFGRP